VQVSERPQEPLMGLVILRNFRPEGNDWVGGTVIDPENGKEYKGKLWMVEPTAVHARLHRLLTAGTHPGLEASALIRRGHRLHAGWRPAWAHSSPGWPLSLQLAALPAVVFEQNAQQTNQHPTILPTSTSSLNQ